MTILKIMAMASLLGVLGFPVPANSAPGWEWQWLNPRPTGNSLIKVAFQDSLRGVLVSDNGETAETRDGGETWTTRPGRIPYNNLVAVTTPNGDLILGGSNDGKIWKSSDGGRTWKSPFKVNGSLYDIDQCGAEVVLAVGAEGMILRSEDQGETWVLVQSEKAGPNLLGLHCGEGGFAFAVGGSGTVLKTQDQGKTWIRLPQPSPEVDFTMVAFTDSSTGFATTAWGSVLDTHDGGRTWRATDLDSLSFFRGLRVDGLNLTVTGSDGKIWKSSDGGGKWIRSQAATEFYLASSAMAGAGTEIIVGNHGTILRSSDDGATWKSKQAGTAKQIMGLATVSPSAWVAFGAKGLVMKTGDRGETWKEAVIGDGSTVLAASFQGRQGLLSTIQGAVYRSGDSGDTWNEVAVPSQGRRLFGVTWCDADTALSVGDSGTVLRSTDGGESWNPLSGISGVTDQTLSAVGCMASGEAHIVGYRGLILKSTDKGATWKSIPTPVENHLYAYSFLDATTGMAGGAQGALLLTRDGGESWTRLSTGFPEDWTAGIAWLGPDTAVLVAEWGHFIRIRITTDGGQKWEELANPTGKLLWALAKLDSGQVAVMGENGALLLGRLTGGPSGIRKLEQSFRERSSMRVSRMGSLPLVRIILPPQARKHIRINAYSMEGRLLQQVYSGTPPVGLQPLLLSFPIQGAPVVFRLQSSKDGKSDTMTSILFD